MAGIFKKVIIVLVVILAVALSHNFIMRNLHENRILKEIISRLEADSRVAEAVVTNTAYDDNTKNTKTTIKFLEYDVNGEPLQPKYFTFSGNILQFQSLVVRFKDEYIKSGDRLKGKSIYLFWKVFMLDGANTEEYEITGLKSVPLGYGVPGGGSYERRIWESFWEYALDAKKKDSYGIKNAQIEAPGTKFIPGILYTIRVEHDGGIRIDAVALSPILKGEKIPDH